MLDKVAMGEEYSELSFRRLLDANLIPLYEERSHLTVTFPRIALLPNGPGVGVQAAISEGPQWSLGLVRITGEALPGDEMRKAAAFAEGKPANWTKIKESIARMEGVLKRSGYLGASSKPTRSFRENERIVDLEIKVNQGRQFFFGALETAGLTDAERQQALRMWKLPAGAPLDDRYWVDFLHSFLENVRRNVKCGVDHKLRPGTNIIDEVLKCQ